MPNTTTRSLERAEAASANPHVHTRGGVRVSGLWSLRRNPTVSTVGGSRGACSTHTETTRTLPSTLTPMKPHYCDVTAVNTSSSIGPRPSLSGRTGLQVYVARNRLPWLKSLETASSPLEDTLPRRSETRALMFTLGPAVERSRRRRLEGRSLALESIPWPRTISTIPGGALDVRAVRRSGADRLVLVSVSMAYHKRNATALGEISSGRPVTDGIVPTLHNALYGC